jgi:eight-cysteine-cluster-containing protein
MKKLPWLVALLLLSACPKKNERPAERPDVQSPPPPPPAGETTGDRKPAVAKDHPLYARVEGTGFENGCASDGTCMTSGCSGEVCSAENVNTTCEMPADGFPKGEGCGCVSGECVWFTSGASALPRQGSACPKGECAPGLQCMEYYGVAGPAGPKLTSCEIACAEKETCPNGQTCVTIADGPGRVCRAAR